MKEILILATGISLFLFGMVRLSVEVQKLFTAQIRDFIKYSVKKPVYGFLVGVVSTIVFQSSSATTVLTISMVNAGLITFYHSLGVLLGSDIGTTLTVQLVVWNITDISPLFIIIGVILWLAGTDKWKISGEAIFYFGLIFFGLSLTSFATAPLKGHEGFIRLLQTTENPLIGVLLGALFTGIVQASAVPIGICVILAQHDLITIEGALPIVFGANVGTTVTALLASTVASINGRRTAISHFLFKFVGLIFCLLTLPFFIFFLKSLSVSIAQQIAIAHFLFNLSIVFIFFFILAPYARLIEKVIPGDEEILPLWPDFLNKQSLANPSAALVNVEKELHRQMKLVEKTYREYIGLRINYYKWGERKIVHIMNVVETVRDDILHFLCMISKSKLSYEQSRKLFILSSMADDIKRIGDHANRLAILSKKIYYSHVSFSETANKDLEKIELIISKSLIDSISLIEKHDEKKINDINAREEMVDVLVKEAREGHLLRYCNGICHSDAGPLFVEMVLHLERISDLCHNVAGYVEELKEI